MNKQSGKKGFLGPSCCSWVYIGQSNSLFKIYSYQFVATSLLFSSQQENGGSLYCMLYVTCGGALILILGASTSN